jgi:hypothetical protein
MNEPWEFSIFRPTRLTYDIEQIMAMFVRHGCTEKNNTERQIWKDKILEHPDFCSGEIRNEHFTNASDYILFLEGLTTGRIYGSICFSFGPNDIHVEYLCAPPVPKKIYTGTLLLNKIKEVGYALNKEYIYLTSVEKAVGFYEKNGFTKDGSSHHDYPSQPGEKILTIFPMKYYFRKRKNDSDDSEENIHQPQAERRKVTVKKRRLGGKKRRVTKKKTRRSRKRYRRLHVLH